MKCQGFWSGLICVGCKRVYQLKKTQQSVPDSNVATRRRLLAGEEFGFWNWKSLIEKRFVSARLSPLETRAWLKRPFLSIMANPAAERSCLGKRRLRWEKMYIYSIPTTGGKKRSCGVKKMSAYRQNTGFKIIQIHFIAVTFKSGDIWNSSLLFSL